MEERRELPERRLAGNAFWRIFKATERSYLYLYAEILGARPTLGEAIVQNRARTYRAVTDRASC